MPTALKLLTAVMEYGDRTHTGNWRDFWHRGNMHKLLDKVLRHGLTPEELDESGLPHLAHALCDLVFYLELKYGSETNSSDSTG